MSDPVKRALAAVMFTDMVGFTALMQADEALALLKRERHRKVLEETHRKFHGQILHFFGDGTLSVFESVVEAVRCGVAIQQALQQDPKVALRIGIHTGDIVFSDNDVIGDGVNIASRLETLAVPGSVLISSKVLDDIRNQQDILTTSVGLFELKNVAEPVEVFAIANEGLIVPKVEEIAGKGTLFQQHKHNLPTQLTSFIGRDREVAEIKTILLQHRLVTLSGPGGTGKTRLSIRVAEELLPHFRDGVYFVELAPLRQVELLAPAIAKVLKVEENPARPILESVQEFLKEKKLLLVLDNFEQIVDAAIDIRSLLRQCLELKILVTSRIVLRLEGEQEYQVQPLPLPDTKRLMNLEMIRQFPSVQLFIQRAKAAKTGFELSLDNAFELAEICHRLDGLPLAIELAAARIRLFSPKILLEKLDQNLDVLRARERGRPERHQTLRQTIDWSYQLLSVEEQILFQQLSVFTGHFTLEAVDHICQSQLFPTIEIYEGIEALVDQSLIRPVELGNGEARFIMLETIKEFAWESLVRTGKAEALRRIHAQYYLDYVEKAAPELTGKDQYLWMRQIQANYDNIRTAILWAIEKEESEIGLRFGNALWRYWITHNRVEGWQRLEQLLTLPVEEDQLAYRANTLNAIGAVINSTTDPNLARDILLESLAILRKLDEKASLATCLNHLGCTEYLTNHYERSRNYSREALELGQRLGMQRTISTAYNNLGWADNFQCRLEEAQEYLLKGSKIRKEIGDFRGYAFMLTTLAFTQSRMGKFEEAEQHFQQAFSILEKIGDTQLLAWAFTTSAESYLAQMKWANAKQSFEKALALWEELVNVYGEVQARIYLIDTLVALDEFTEIDPYLQRANAKIKNADLPLLRGKLLKVRARLAFKQAQFEQAEVLALEAAAILYPIEDFLSVAEVLDLLAQLKKEAGKTEAAAHALICAKALRRNRKLFIPPRFVERLVWLEEVLHRQMGDQKWAVLEKTVSASLEEEIQKYLVQPTGFAADS